MLINTTTKFNHDDSVLYRLNTNKPWNPGRIIAIRIYQPRHFRSDAFMVYYCIEPIEMIGFEHDNEEWIFEADVTRK